MHQLPENPATKTVGKHPTQSPLSRWLSRLLACTGAVVLIGCGDWIDGDNGGLATLVNTEAKDTDETAAGDTSDVDAASANPGESAIEQPAPTDGVTSNNGNAPITVPPNETSSSESGSNDVGSAATNPPVGTSGSAQTPVAGDTGTTNSVQLMIDDMRLMNDAVLVGINPSYGFAKGPGYVIMGNIPRSANLPAWYAAQYPQMTVTDWWNYILPWFVLFEGEGNQSSQTRVQMRNLRLYILSRTTNQWQLVSTAQDVGGELCPAGSNMHQCAGGNNKRSESSGGVSFLPVPGTAFHGWFGSKQQIEGWDVKAVHVTLQARLTSDDSADMADARFLFDVGADYYPSEGPSPIFLPGVGVSRAKLISPQWQSFSFTSLSDVGKQEPGGGITESELRQNPPPMD